MTEGEISSLEEEKNLCLGKLRAYTSTLTDLNRQKEEVWSKYCEWKERYEKADMKLALETKLTVIKKGKGREDSLHTILKDKKKVKELIRLLKEELANQ